jgi:hypothetical protein
MLTLCLKWFLKKNNTLPQNFSEKNVLKKKKLLQVFFSNWKNKNQKQTLKDDIYAKQQGCEINVTHPLSLNG